MRRASHRTLKPLIPSGASSKHSTSSTSACGGPWRQNRPSHRRRPRHPRRPLPRAPSGRFSTQPPTPALQRPAGAPSPGRRRPARALAPRRGAAPARAQPADPEVIQHDLGHVGDRPLPSRVRGAGHVGAAVQERERSQRVATAQRAVAPAADVVASSPVHELVLTLCGDEHVTCAGTMQGGPHAAKRVRVGAAGGEPIVLHQLNRVEAPVQVPGHPAAIGQAASRA